MDHVHFDFVEDVWADAQLVWAFHQMGHVPRPCSVGLGLGSYDIGVAKYAAELFHSGLFPVLVFSGSNDLMTADRFPRGEAIHFGECARLLQVPAEAIVLEPRATNTGENIQFSRKVLSDSGVDVDSVLVISKPYMQRRACATINRLWPEVEVVCASEDISLTRYVERVGDAKMVIDMIVGDLQRLIVYPEMGFAVEQEIPDNIRAAFRRLVRSGFDSRLLR